MLAMVPGFTTMGMRDQHTSVVIVYKPTTQCPVCQLSQLQALPFRLQVTISSRHPQLRKGCAMLAFGRPKPEPSLTGFLEDLMRLVGTDLHFVSYDAACKHQRSHGHAVAATRLCMWPHPEHARVNL